MDYDPSICPKHLSSVGGAFDRICPRDAGDPCERFIRVRDGGKSVHGESVQDESGSITRQIVKSTTPPSSPEIDRSLSCDRSRSRPDVDSRKESASGREPFQHLVDPRKGSANASIRQDRSSSGAGSFRALSPLIPSPPTSAALDVGRSPAESASEVHRPPGPPIIFELDESALPPSESLAPEKVDPARFTIDEDYMKPELDWYMFRRKIIDYANPVYGRNSRAKVMEICALLFMAVHRLKPGTVRKLRWHDLKKSYIVISARKGSAVKIGYLTETMLKLLGSYRFGEDDAAPIFGFTERTFERIVKRILGSDYTPMDVCKVKDARDKTAGEEFPLYRSLKQLGPTASIPVTGGLFPGDGKAEEWEREILAKRGTSPYYHTLEHPEDSRHKTRHIKRRKVSGFPRDLSGGQ